MSPLPKKISDLIPALNLIPHPEGGFFVETFRSGCPPMSTQGQTGYTTTQNPNKDLITTTDNREQNRSDGDVRRNTLTSIYWIPTLKSTDLILGVNYSDHVHYYQGGLPFKYILFHPNNNSDNNNNDSFVGGRLEEIILGPALDKGHKLQVCVEGGIWKCGHICNDDGSDLSPSQKENSEYEYTIIGEAVAPGFDYHDFQWVTEEEIKSNCSCKGSNRVKGGEKREGMKMVEKMLMRFVHKSVKTVVVNKDDRNFDFEEYYDENDVQKNRVNERS